MSPRAACRLEGLGFTQVYDYVVGIADWKAAGLPTEGAADHKQRVLDATRGDVPTCRPGEAVSEVRSRVRAGGWETCVVVECDGIVVGGLRSPAWDTKDYALVGEVMEPGPTTVRPDGLLQPLIHRMQKKDTPHVLVTNPQGTLTGVLLRADGERVLAGQTPDQIWRDCDGCPGSWAPSI